MYYSHQNQYFQLQVFFNKNIVFNETTNTFVESFIFHYIDFDNLFIDWLYCFECIKKEKFDVYKNNAIRVYSKDITLIKLKEEEKDAAIIERNGKHYLIIRTDEEEGPLAFMNHISFKKIEESNE